MIMLKDNNINGYDNNDTITNIANINYDIIIMNKEPILLMIRIMLK